MAMRMKSPKRAVGLKNALQKLYPLQKVAQRAPTVNDYAEIGTIWVDQVGEDIYMLVKISGGDASWAAIGAGAGIFDSVTSTTFVAAATTVTAGTTITAGTGLTITTGDLTIGDMNVAGVITNTAAGVLESSTGTDGQILIDSTAGAPAWANLTAGAGINIGNAANAITITATGATAVQYTADDANTIIPDGAGNVNVLGGTNVGTTAAIANTLTINVDDNPTFAGLVTAQAGFTQSAGTTSITSDTNAANAIELIADGGVNEVISIYSRQGTDLTAAIDIVADNGGVTIESGLAAGTAINIDASNAAGGMNITSGTGGTAVFSTGGIDMDAQAASAFTVTGAFDLTFDSTLGSIVIDGGEAAADAIQLTASNAAGGVTGAVGTGGYILDATNGPFTLTTGTGNISIGADAADHDIVIGNATGATSFTVNAGTGAVAIASNATDHATTLGSVTGGSALTLQAGTDAFTCTAGGIFDVNAVGAITIDSSGGAIGIGVDADAFDINIGIGASSRDIVIGNATGTTSFTVNAGTGAVAIASNATDHATTLGSVTGGSALTLQAGTDAFTCTAGGIFDVNAVGAITIDSSAGAIGIGVNADAFDINIGIGPAQRDITIGNVTGATSFTVDCGTGGCSIGSSATAHTTTVGSTNTTSDTIIQSGTGGVSIDGGGLINPNPDTQTAASPVATVTSDVNVGVATFTGYTTAAAATQAFTITNALVSATSGILVSIANLGANDARMMIQRVTPAAGSFVVDTINNGTQALNDDVIISFWVLN